MEYKVETRRGQQRLKLWLPVRVLCRDAGGERVEQTFVQDVTTLGARFTLSRPVEWGRLIHLTMEMPKQLRLYDLDVREYGVWAVVRHVRPFKLLGASRPQATQYQVGAAFAGREPPASFLEDPSTLYEIVPPPRKEEMWGLSEILEEEDAPAEEPPPREDARAEERFLIPYEVLLEFLNSKAEVSASEESVSSNISRRGASVPTTLKAANGSYVRLTIAEEGFTVLAVVRDQTLDSAGVSRLHLEFIDGVWEGGRGGETPGTPPHPDP